MTETQATVARSRVGTVGVVFAALAVIAPVGIVIVGFVRAASLGEPDPYSEIIAQFVALFLGGAVAIVLGVVGLVLGIIALPRPGGRGAGILAIMISLLPAVLSAVAFLLFTFV